MLPVLVLFSLVSLLTLTGHEAQSATRYWVGDVSAEWTEPKNWDGDFMPSTGDVIIIDKTYPGYTNEPILSTVSGFKPIELVIRNAGRLYIYSGGDLDVAGLDVYITGAGSRLDVSGGILSISGGVGDLRAETSGHIIQTGGTISIGDALMLKTGAVMKIDGSSSVLDITGDLLIQGADSEFDMDEGIVYVRTDLSLDGNGCACNSTEFDVSGGTMTISGSLTIDGFAGDQPDINISGGLIKVTADLTTNAGSLDLDISGGEIILTSSLTMSNASDIISMSGGTMSFDGAANWDNKGTFAATAGSVDFEGATNLLNGVDWQFYNINVLSGKGFSQVSATEIKVSADWINFGNYTHTNNQVTFNGGSLQYLGGNSPIVFYDLEMDNTGDLQLQQSGVSVDNLLIFTAGDIVLDDYRLTLGTSAAISGSPGQNSYVQADEKGVMRKEFNGVSTFAFPVGDMYDFSPFTIIPTGVTLSGGTDYLEVNLVNAKHSQVDSSLGHITKYWTLNSGGFTALIYNVLFSYVDADVLGNETGYFTKRWDGSAWSTYDPVDAGNNLLTSSGPIAALPINHVFTGFGADPLVISVQSGSWSVPSTWNCNCVPDSTDDVIIATGHTVFSPAIITVINSVDIQTGANLAIYFDVFRVKGNLTLNGQFDGAEKVYLLGAGSNIDGTGYFTNTDEVIIKGNKTVLNSAILSMVGGDFIIDGADTITNFGTISLNPATLEANNSNALFVNGAGAILNLGNAGFIANGKLDASATGNVVNYYRAGAQDIKAPISSYYNLKISNSGSKELKAAIDINGDLTIQDNASFNCGG
ncbi:MAG: hypothetical protein IH946_09745, partial [Bacteroidetes bacterium]|nr:hypothetical protein [Bacteroidota bacterium]